MDTFEPGDELSHVKLSAPLSLAGLSETTLSCEKHHVKLKAHPRGVLLEHKGDTWLLFDGALVAAKKVKKAEPTPIKKAV